MGVSRRFCTGVFSAAALHSQVFTPTLHKYLFQSASLGLYQAIKKRFPILNSNFMQRWGLQGGLCYRWLRLWAKGSNGQPDS